MIIRRRHTRGASVGSSDRALWYVSLRSHKCLTATQKSPDSRGWFTSCVFCIQMRSTNTDVQSGQHVSVHTHTHKHTHMYIYLYIYIYKYMCAFQRFCIMCCYLHMQLTTGLRLICWFNNATEHTHTHTHTLSFIYLFYSVAQLPCQL